MNHPPGLLSQQRQLPTDQIERRDYGGVVWVQPLINKHRTFHSIHDDFDAKRPLRGSPTTETGSAVNGYAWPRPTPPPACDTPAVIGNE